MSQAPADSKTENHNPLWSSLVRNLSPYVPGQQTSDPDVVKLNTNESPFGPSPEVAKAISAALTQEGTALRLYPEPESKKLRQAIATHHGLEADQVFVGNGSDEVLAHIFAAFFKKDRPLFYPDITYSFYPVYAQLFGINARQIPLNAEFEIDPDAYRAPCDGIIFANPNAPTGKLLPLDAIRKILSEHPHATVVIDEAYIDFGGVSAVELLPEFENLVITRTLSKSRALAGLRVGYALAAPSMIEALTRVKNSFNSYPLDRLAQTGAIASFEDEAYFAARCQEVADLRDSLTVDLEGLGFSVLQSTANFVMASHPAGAAHLYEQLEQRKILVRHFDKPRLKDFLRITVGTEKNHEVLIEALKEILAELS